MEKYSRITLGGLGSNHNRDKDFSFSRTSIRALGTTQSWSSNRAISRVEADGCKIKPFPPSSAYVKNEWSYTSTLHIWFDEVDK
jgi:hypothetical protein